MPPFTHPVPLSPRNRREISGEYAALQPWAVPRRQRPKEQTDVRGIMRKSDLPQRRGDRNIAIHATGRRCARVPRLPVSLFRDIAAIAGAVRTVRRVTAGRAQPQDGTGPRRTAPGHRPQGRAGRSPNGAAGARGLVGGHGGGRGPGRPAAAPPPPRPPASPPPKQTPPPPPPGCRSINRADVGSTMANSRRRARTPSSAHCLQFIEEAVGGNGFGSGCGEVGAYLLFGAGKDGGVQGGAEFTGQFGA